MAAANHEVDHELSDADENVHHVWDNSLDPALTIEPGEVVRFECRDALDGQVTPDSGVLCSAAVDLKLSEVVDAPNWTVTAFVPESVFPE